jgi:hypothetical protein
MDYGSTRYRASPSFTSHCLRWLVLAFVGLCCSLNKCKLVILYIKKMKAKRKKNIPEARDVSRLEPLLLLPSVCPPKPSSAHVGLRSPSLDDIGLRLPSLGLLTAFVGMCWLLWVSIGPCWLSLACVGHRWPSFKLLSPLSLRSKKTNKRNHKKRKSVSI